jgi:hypothetical protein
MDSVKTVSVVDELATSSPIAEPVVDVAPFIGCWLSTNKGTQGIARLIVAHDETGLRVRAFGAGVPSLHEWGEVKAVVFADSATSNVGRAFRAFYDLGFKETILQAKVKKGVLVVANFNRFTDGSRRASYFSREFFYRAAM